MATAGWDRSLFMLVLVCVAPHLFAEVIIRPAITGNALQKISFTDDMFAKFYLCLYDNDTAVTCKAPYDFKNVVTDISREGGTKVTEFKISSCNFSPGREFICDRLDYEVDTSQVTPVYIRPSNDTACANSSTCAGLISIVIDSESNIDYCPESCPEPTVSSSTASTTTISTTTITTTTVSTSILPADTTATAATSTSKSTQTTQKPSQSPTPSTPIASPEPTISSTTSGSHTSADSHNNTTAATNKTLGDKDGHGDTDDELVYIIVGVVCGFIVLLVVVIVIIRYVRRRRKRASRQLIGFEESSLRPPAISFENKAFAPDGTSQTPYPRVTLPLVPTLSIKTEINFTLKSTGTAKT